MSLSFLRGVGLIVGCAGLVRGQDTTRAVPLQSVSRDQAADLALSHGAQAAFAAATARAADAQLKSARTFSNPTLNATYSKDVPQYHAIVDLPLDFLTIRSARIALARSAAEAAHEQLALDRAAVRLDVDTLYTRALAAAGHAALSRRDAIDADSLFTIARVRHDAGDASELDLELARVNAGQFDNAAVVDSVERIASTLDLQAALGLPAQAVGIALTDSLGGPTLDSLARLAGPPLGTPLSISAAEHNLQAAEQSISAQRRSMWSGLSLTAGVEGHDPISTDPSVEKGVLPTAGLSIPLPILNQAGGDVAVAEAERDRAKAELELARRESAEMIAQSQRGLAAAVVRADRDRTLVASAQRVAQMALQAYAEGAYPVASVLEAQHNARTALGQLIDDTAAAANAAAALRFFTTTAVP